MGGLFFSRMVVLPGRVILCSLLSQYFSTPPYGRLVSISAVRLSHALFLADRMTTRPAKPGGMLTNSDCRRRSAHGRLVLRTVNAEIRAAEWYAKEPTVMGRRLIGMDVLKEEPAGHAHSGDGY